MSNQIPGPKNQSLDDLSAYLGREFAFEGVDEVTRSDIRRKLEVHCFYCPIHYEEDAAKTHGYRTLVAPNTMTSLWAMPAYWSPGEPMFFGPPGQSEKVGGVQLDIPTSYTNTVNAETQWEFFEPVYPGDRLRGIRKLVDIKPRRTRVGDGVFLTGETTIWKQTGELVATNRNTGYHYNENPDGAKELKAAPIVGPLAPESPPERVPAVDWSHQRYLEDVTVGEQVPSHQVWLTYQRIMMGAAADRMFSSMHHNRDYAREAGLADIIFNTKGYELLAEITLRKWIGLDGRLKRLGPFRMSQNSYPGDTVICRARVIGTQVLDGQGIASLEIWYETPRKGEMARGEAVIGLPLRRH